MPDEIEVLELSKGARTTLKSDEWEREAGQEVRERSEGRLQLVLDRGEMADLVQRGNDLEKLAWQTPDATGTREAARQASPVILPWPSIG